MQRYARSGKGVAHAGPTHHHDRRSHNPMLAYRLCGSISEISPDDQMLWLAVEGGHGRAGRFRGQTLAVNLAGARFSVPDGEQSQPLGGLMVGDKVCVRARLPRRISQLPESVQALAVEEIEGSPQRLNISRMWAESSHRKLKRKLRQSSWRLTG